MNAVSGFADFRHDISTFANFSYGIAVLGIPHVPLLNNWFDNSCSPINNDCACLYFYEFEFEISDLSSYFPTRHLADTRLKSVVNPVLYCYSLRSRRRKGRGKGRKGKKEGIPFSPLLRFSPTPLPLPFCACHAG